MSEKRLLVDELHTPARRNFPWRHDVAHKYNDLWQADVVEMRFNRGFRYILTVIDVLNKHAWAKPFKVKSWNEVTKAISKIIRDDRRCPKNWHIDGGKKFYNSNVQKLLKKHNINHYIAKPEKYVFRNEGLDCRFNRTLKNDMWKQFTHNGNY